MLSRHGLLRAALVDPGDAALRLEAALASRPEGETGVTLALAELWYRAALRQPHHASASAVPPLRAAAAAAALALADPEVGCCDRAVHVHNDAVARLVRISQDERVSLGARTGRGPWPGSGSWRLGAIRSLTRGGSPKSWWPPTCMFAGMRHRFRTCGLGVPVVGTRCVDRNHPTERDEQFFPSRLRIAATVLAAPGGGLAGGAYRLSPLSLVFHDPFRVDSALAGGRALPLAADRTTHLALQASQDRLPAQAIRGVIATEFGPEIEPGLFMLRPYAPDKIPLVFVHGLAATPVAFLQAINEFQNDPGSRRVTSSGSSSIRPAGRSWTRPCGCERSWAGPRRRTEPIRPFTGWSSSGIAWAASSPTWSCRIPAGRSGTAP